MFNIPLVESITPAAATLWPDLAAVLSRLPSTVCRRKTACCALLPQMTLLEAGRLIERLKKMDLLDQRSLLKRLVSYFHLNAACIMGCPFLSDHMCLVYDVRPFGCRAYGLWSPNVYRRMAEAGIQSKKAVKEAWASLGVSLPQEVVEHKPPYCRNVVLEGEDKITDRFIRDVEQKLQQLNLTLAPEAQIFDRQYYSDLSFLMSGSLWDPETCLKNKVNVVREYTTSGQSTVLEALLCKLDLVS